MNILRFKEKVLSFMEKHQLIDSDTSILVGVSGGADSLLLLRFLVSLRDEWRLHITAISVDHGLRGKKAKEDVHYVKEMCRKWNVTFIGEHINVNERKKKHKEGTQLAARTLRYQLFEETMNQRNIPYLALAHHGDDQVETVLMRIVRQSNPSALKGIPVKRKFANGNIIRPFLCLSKEEIYQACEAYHIIPREDPSNQSPAYTRNFYRLNVLPHLKKQNHLVHEHVQRLTERMAEDETYLLLQTEKLLDEIVTFRERVVSFEIEAFKNYPISLQRRAFHLILNYLYKHKPVDISIQHETDFFHLLQQQKSNVTVDFPSFLKIAKVYHTIRFHFQDTLPEEWKTHRLVKVPSVMSLMNGGTLKVSYTSEMIQESNHTLLIPVENEFLFPLSLRVRQSGDRMKVRGLNGRKKVKDIFIDEKIPVHERDNWPLLFGADGTLLWMVGLRKAELNTDSKSGRYVMLTYQEQDNGRQ